VSYYARNRVAIRHKARMKRLLNVPAAIFEDSRKTDRKADLYNDLTLDFVQALASNPCVYCGTTSVRMSLDRKDNSKGHTKDNVVRGCVRCNYTRGDMPYEAWVVVADGMRKAVELDLFGSWVGGPWEAMTMWVGTARPGEPPVLGTLIPIVQKRNRLHGTLSGYQVCGPPRCAACKIAMRNWKRSRRAR
jgi:hypothetical protein